MNNKEITFAPYREQYKQGKLTYQELQDKYFEIFIKPEVKKPEILKKV